MHEGIYREWVNPSRGGKEGKRIIYRAAPGEKITITGAEIITAWENVGGTVWKTVIPNSFFGSYNPYREAIYGDWLFTLDKVFHIMCWTRTLKANSDPLNQPQTPSR